jgi:Fic family protein
MRRISGIIYAYYAEFIAMKYIHDLKNWPEFHWDQEHLTAKLASLRHQQGRLIGRMEALGFKLRSEAILQTLTEDVLKSSEIEGEKLDKEQVRSSIARHLGMEISGLVPSDRDVEGVVEMMLDATQKYNQKLTQARLFDWHASLFPTGRSGMRKIRVGKWRDDKAGPMEVVSGPIGREKVHYEAPSANRLSEEMRTFLSWFNRKDSIDPVLKAALAHLWFVTIHPFDDGNGRIARAVADMLLAQSEKSSQRFYSMSAQIRKERKAYYKVLEITQKKNLDITDWLDWFLDCLERAIKGSETTLEDVLEKARFWEKYGTESLNDRQRKILNRLMDGFEGKLTSSKWAKLGKCSQDTASRDIDDLIKHGILIKNPAGGRSTSYSLIKID